MLRIFCTEMVCSHYPPPSSLVPEGVAAGRALELHQHHGEGTREWQGPGRVSMTYFKNFSLKLQGLVLFSSLLEGLFVIITPLT
jgi:hypothetical protein